MNYQCSGYQEMLKPSFLEARANPNPGAVRENMRSHTELVKSENISWFSSKASPEVHGAAALITDAGGHEGAPEPERRQQAAAKPGQLSAKRSYQHRKRGYRYRI